MIKEGIKTVLNKYVGKIKIIAIVILLIVFVGILWKEILYEETEHREDDNTSTNWVVDNYTSNVTIDEEGTINLNQTPEELWNEMIENGNNVDQYLDDYTELARLMYAQLITQYVYTEENPEEEIDIDQMIEDEEFVGLIKIKRAIDNDTTIYMTYADEEIFQSYKDEYEASASAEAKTYLEEHFTIRTTETIITEEDNEVSETITAEDEEEDEEVLETQIEEEIEYVSFTEIDTTFETNNPEIEEYTNFEYYLTTKTLDYGELVDGYAMPFDLLWDLLLVTNDKDFVMELVELVYESEFEITLFENYMEYTTITENTYTENEKIEYDTYVEAEYRESFEDSEVFYADDYDYYVVNHSNEYFEKETIINKTYNVSAQLTKVNMWLIEYEKTYTYCEFNIEDTYSESEPTILEDIDDGTFTYNPYSEDTDPEGRVGVLKDRLRAEIPEEYTYLSYTKSQTSKTYLTYIDREEILTTYNEGYTYTSGVETTIEKTDKEPEDPEEENFVTLLLASQTAKSSIRELDEWLFEIIELNPNISDWVDIMKYLLYKAYDDESYGVFELNMDIFTNSSFSVIGNNPLLTVTSLSREEFISAGEAYSTDFDYVMYMVPYLGDFYDICESYGLNACITFGHACLETGYGGSWNCINYHNYFGIDHNTGETTGEYFETYPECITAYCELLTKYTTPGESLYNDNVSRAEEYATVNNLFIGAPETNIYVGYTIYVSLDTGVLEDEAEHSARNTDDRMSIATTIFGEEYTLTTDLLQAADEYFTYLVENGWDYSLNTSLLGYNDIEYSTYTNPNKRVCCATFVNAILYTAGYISEETMNLIPYNYTIGSMDYYEDILGWEIIYDYNDLQPGDIAFKYRDGGGHLQMYAGDGTWYNMGGTSSINRAQPYESTMTDFYKAARPVPVQ